MDQIKMISLLVIFVALLISCHSQIIDTQYGPILGRSRESALGRNYFSFQRIPYMRPPVGTLRFRDPQPPDNWTLPLDCTQEGPRFPQIDLTLGGGPGAQFGGDLDSMHINVYTNNLTPQSRYPVLLFIFGGGFRTGSAGTEIYGPDYFIEQEVVVVTFNYRLYAFGWLSLDDPELEIPGNAGFKDQVMALKWVKQNIANFGGDPERITVFGQSSGGGSAHYHTLSDASRDLFQRAIIMSGSAFNNMYGVVPRRNWALRLAKALNYTGEETDRAVLAFLEVAEPEAIFRAVGDLLTDEERDVERILNAFGPTIEPYVTENAFMLDHPERLAVNSWGQNINFLIGGVSLENGPLIPLLQTFRFFFPSFANFSTWIPMGVEVTKEQRQIYGALLERTYYGMSVPTPTNIDGLVILSGEFAFWHSVHRVVKQRLMTNANGRSWVYRYDADSNNNCFKPRNNVPAIYREPIHMDDLCHLFKTSFEDVPAENTVGWRTIQLMVGIFTRFAAVGDPQVELWVPSDGTGGIPPLTGYNIHDINSTVGPLPEVDRMEVWDLIHPISASIKLQAFNLLVFLLALIKIIF